MLSVLLLSGQTTAQDAHCPADYVPWKNRMAALVDSIEASQTTHGANGGRLFTVADVEYIEQHADLRFNITRPTTILYECPYSSTQKFDNPWVPSCARCASRHLHQGAHSTLADADVLFRFGIGGCTTAEWPAKLKPDQLFVSALGEASAGTGAPFYAFKHSLPPEHDDDVFLSYDADEDVSWSSDNWDSLPVELNNAERRIATIARVWFEAFSPAELSMRSPPGTPLALYVSSNCSPRSHRDIVVAELIEHGVDVSSHGACLRNSHPIELLADENNYQAKVRIGRKFKFVLALENTIEKGYVTEKIHHAYLAGAVPIVWQRAWLAPQFPQHSFIAVEDFSDTEALARHLLALSTNDTAYLEYQRWRVDGVTSGTVKQWFRNFDLIGCQLCEMQNHRYTSRACGKHRMAGSSKRD